MSLIHLQGPAVIGPSNALVHFPHHGLLASVTLPAPSHKNSSLKTWNKIDTPPPPACFFLAISSATWGCPFLCRPGAPFPGQLCTWARAAEAGSAAVGASIVYLRGMGSLGRSLDPSDLRLTPCQRRRAGLPRMQWNPAVAGAAAQENVRKAIC